MKLKRALAAMVLCAILFACFTSSAGAGKEGIPSLFCNDEEWHKDTVSPLIFRNGKYFIPAGLFSMLTYMDVTNIDDNSLLIYNTQNEKYISVLFKEQSAAINGDIVNNVGIFRDDGVYYIDANLACKAVGLKIEYYTSDSGSVSLRITDDNCIFTMEELIDSYISDDEDIFYPDDNNEDVVKRIYLLCTSPDGRELMFPARDNLEAYELEYTMFLDASSTEETILSSIADGEYGFAPLSADELDELNKKVSRYSNRTSRLVLSTGDAEADSILRDRGYCPIVPDFTVNGSTYADGLLVEIIGFLNSKESCTVYLDDYWSSQRLMVLISDIDYNIYVTSNLTDVN